MSEPFPKNNSEGLTAEVQNYLRYATVTLLSNGIAKYLKEDRAFTEQVTKETEDGIDLVWHLKRIQAFHDAELPFAVMSYTTGPDEATEGYPEGTDYQVVKIDSRGHIFQCEIVDMFRLYPDGTTDEDRGHIPDVDQGLKDVIIELNEMQKSLSWEPIFDPEDLPPHPSEA